MADQFETRDKVFDVPKKDAARLVGKSQRTLQRWVEEGLLEVAHRSGPYGQEAYYNRGDLLKMRAGKPRQGDDAPLAKADLAVIARGAEWSNEQLSKALANISEQLPIIQEQLQALVKAKDETIEAKEEQGKLKEEIGKLKQSETQLKGQQSQLQKQLSEMEEHHQQALEETQEEAAQAQAKGQRRFTSVVAWGVVTILAVFVFSLAFAPQLGELRELIASLLLR